MAQHSYPRHSRVEVNYIVLAFTTVLLTASYVLIRYGRFWNMGGDTQLFSETSMRMIESGQLVTGSAYPNGYGFQSLVTFIVHISGMDMVLLQSIGSALLVAWLILPTWLLYRAFLETPRGAALATAILFVQPEFLFGITRGTHEKFTRGLMMLCLFLLIISLRSQQRSVRSAGAIISFVVIAYSLVAFNNLMATSFIAAIGLSLLMLMLLDNRYIRPHILHISRNVKRRLAFATAISLILSFLFVFYLYEPALRNLLFLNTVFERLSALFLEFETTAINPYEVAQLGWRNTYIYFLLSLSNWILLLGSLTVWLWYTLAWLRKTWQPESYGILLLWLSFTVFAFQGTVSVFIDISGSIGNLQHRLFPTFTMLAAPLVAFGIIHIDIKSPFFRRIAYGSVAAIIGILAVLSLLKATNEPLFSNKWMFFNPSEITALQWTNTKLEGRSVWTGYDERLDVAVRAKSPGQTLNIQIDRFVPHAQTRDYIISSITRTLSSRLAYPLPIEHDSFLTYDNGSTQIYHLRSRTLFQR
jgi:hypothetical protein